MAASQKRSALANLPAPPALGSIQFFDGYFPALDAGSYTITLTHTVGGNAGAPPAFAVQPQTVVVEAPEFTIDPGIVQTNYPPNGSSDIYARTLPFVVLTDPALPWERSLTPGQGSPDVAEPGSWMALLVFAEGEIEFQPNSANPVSTCTVAQLLAPDLSVAKPQLDASVSDTAKASQCQTITIPGAVFNAVVPSTKDLPFLAHCRGINTLSEGEQLLSVFMANRLPVAASDPPAAVKYFAHLVSLEGWGASMGPMPSSPIGKKPGSDDLMDVQMVSLYAWTFTSLPESGLSFTALMAGLVESQQATSTRQSTVNLQLPMPPSPAAPAAVQSRIGEGFVALPFATGSGENSFAWYRGPFTATVPQPLPMVGTPPVPAIQAGSADALMIYLAEQGLFDLSYAAAWNLGRNLALADATFSRNISAYRRIVGSSYRMLAQRSAMSHLAGVVDARALLARDASRRRFAGAMAQGLGERWTAALAAVRGGAPPHSPAWRPARRFSSAPAAGPRSLLASPEAAAAVALSGDLSETAETLASWIARLRLLYPLPFSSLVPDPRMLPVESIRFFYVDDGWTDALVAGALSIALQGSADAQFQAALLPGLLDAVGRHRSAAFSGTRPDAAVNIATGSSGASMTGVLIRSQIVSGWPSLVVGASVGGAPLNLVRDDRPSSTVRLCLFDGIPDAVSLSEPYQGVLFGVEDLGIYPRCVTAPAFTGSQIGNGSPVQPTFRAPAPGGLGGVMDVQALAASLEPAVGIVPFASGATVNWNGTPLTTAFVTANQLAASVPADLIAAAGTCEITVANGDATSLPVSFIVDAALEIDTIDPVLMQAGADAFTLSVDGVGFTSGAVVNWTVQGTATALTTTAISVNQMTALVPAELLAAPVSAAITVVTSTGTSNAVSLEVVSANPTITSVAPAVAMAGATGLTLTVAGSGFASGAVVQWNGTALPSARVSDLQVKATVPATCLATAGSAAVTVLLDGTVSNSVAFTVADAVPTISTMAPSVALSGAGQFTLTIEGVNFAADAIVMWGTTSLTPTTSEAEQITVAVPASLVSAPATASVTVQSGGTTSNAMPFLVTGPRPAVGVLVPPMAIAGGPQFTLKVYGGFGAGDLALQLVAAPEIQFFPTI